MPPADNLLIRWATRWDREIIARLLADLAQMHGTAVDRDTADEAFDFALKSPDRVRFCVAERDRIIIGLASLHHCFSTWRAMPYGQIQDVFVTTDARRTGVATGLFDFLATEGKRRGYCRLNLDVKADNAPARAFYAEIGMTDTSYVVYELDLTQPPELPPVL